MNKRLDPPLPFSKDAVRDLFASSRCLETLFGSTEANEGDYEHDPLYERARHTVWRLRRAYEDAVGENIANEIFQYLRELSKRRKEVDDAIVAWFKLTELLLQDTERRFGNATGRGQEKKRHVKAVIVNLLLTSPRFDIPRVPSYLEPLVVDIGADWTIDTLVHLLNHQNLWSNESQPSSISSGPFSRLINFLKSLFAKLQAKVAGFIRRWVLARYRLSEAAQVTINEISRLGLRDELDKIVDDGVKVIGWIGSHRRELFAAIDLVSISVQEAETFLNLSGAQKKSFARDLILVFVEDTGLIRWQTGFWYFFVEWILDGTIDAVVAIFNRHQVFRHRTS
jgi:hypothetical protein